LSAGNKKTQQKILILIIRPTSMVALNCRENDLLLNILHMKVYVTFWSFVIFKAISLQLKLHWVCLLTTRHIIY